MAGPGRHLEKDSVVQPESVVTRAAETITESHRSKEPSARTPAGESQGSMLEKDVISFSSESQFSTDSYDTVFEPRNALVRGSEPCMNDQPAQSSISNKNDQSCSVRSSCEVSDVTYESTLMSPRQCPPLQVMERSGAYEPGRISSSVFTANSEPQEWSMASNESLFSLHVGHIGLNNGVLVMGNPSRKSSDFALSDEVMSNRTSLVAEQEAVRTAAEQPGEQARKSTNDITAHDFIVQNIHNHMNAKVCIPDKSWDPRKSKARIQPLPPLVNTKPEKPSSCCKKWSCCLCSCATLSCCCSTSVSCCSKPRCRCCKIPSCSCCNCSLGWCCNWKCFSAKSCCSDFSCCNNWSCCCPKGSCCPSCSDCSKAICCWNWSCWKLLCCWNWTCCLKGSCCRSWSCCSEGSCCESWSCCSIGSCFKSWSCCSKGSCCKSWSCCSSGTSCTSWNCCSKGTCCRSWTCCSKGSCCGAWNCCSMGSCCKSWNCCSMGSCCRSWNCCSTGSCCKSWSCRPTWKCGSCCCNSLWIKLCCSSTKQQEGRVRPDMTHRHKTKTLGRTGICGWSPCSGCSCC